MGLNFGSTVAAKRTLPFACPACRSYQICGPASMRDESLVPSAPLDRVLRKAGDVGAGE